MNYGFRKALLVLTIVAVVVVPVLAQRFSGDLRGTVTDQSGAVVAGAKVTLTNEATGVSQTTESTSAGVYNFSNLLVGTYTLKIEAKGFAPFANKSIAVSSNQVVEANAKMSVGGESTTVEVAAGAEAVETTTSQVSNTFSAQQVINLPTASANLLNLAVLAPNTTTQGGGVLGQGGSVGGTRPRMNGFNVDGVDDNSQSVTGSLSTVVNDAVAEFNLITNQFSAEYGHSAGGQFNIITKSGTNEWHGSAGWDTQNRNFNALTNIQKQNENPDGSVTKPRYDFNRLSGTIGGPIMKNKWFIFGALQYHTKGLGATGVTVTAPTAEGLASLNGLAANQAVKDILAQFPMAASASCDPTVPEVLDKNDPNYKTLLAKQCQFASHTVIPVGKTNFTSPDFYNEWDWHVNSDLNLTKHRIGVRYLYNRYRTPNLPSPALPQFAGVAPYDVRKGTISDSWTITDRFINDLRFNFTHMKQDYTVPSQFANFPNVTIDSLTNFVIGPEANSPQNGGQNTYQLLDNMTYSRGRHTVKWGIEGRRVISPSNFLPRARGDWYYSDLTNLVTDTVPIDQAIRGAGNGSFPGNATSLYGFIQDDVKVNSRLTLNLGLRYEWNGIPFGSTYQQLNEISNLANVYWFRVPRSDRNNFAPRVGFAWDPTGQGKWSIRGGFGVAYDVIFTNLASLQLPPQLQSEQRPDITCSLPGAPSWCAGYSDAVYQAGGRTGAGFLQNGGLLQVNTPPTTQADARTATGGIIVDDVAPRISTWSLGVQRELFGNSTLEVRYLGTMGVNLPAQVQTNAISPFDLGAKPLTTWFDQTDVPATVPVNTPTLEQFTSFGNRKYPEFGGPVTAFEPWAKSEYHSFATDFTHRFKRGLYLRANYTFAKGWDDATNELFSSLVNPRRPEDGNNLTSDWGRSTLDIRHKVAISWVYDLPKIKSDNAFVKGVFHGWQVGGAYLAQSGQPITAQSARDANGNGDSAGDRAILNSSGTGMTGSDIAPVYMVCTPQVGGGCTPTGATSFTSPLDADDNPIYSTIGYYALTPGARFVRAGVGTRTNIARNTLASPGLNNWDMSLFRNVKFSEKKSLQFRAEFFNVFNHRQFSFANSGVSGLNSVATDAAAYSRVYLSDFMNPYQLDGGSRNIQLGLKFMF